MTDHSHHIDEIDDHDRGLGFDLQTLGVQRGRRAVIGLLGGAAGLGGAALLGGGGAAQAASLLAACSAEIPAETAGPYPADGSNGPDVLSQSGIVRRDLSRSIGASTGRAAGVDFRFTMTLQNTSTCAPVKGLAVYAWHCDRAGRYSMYSAGITDQNYLRGVQVTKDNGKVHFRSICPGCYSGRRPHVHFEVYASRYAATHGGEPIATSQLALPRKQSMHVDRKAAGYSASVTNLERISLRADNVFGDDGGTRQLAAVTGSIGNGYHAKLVVPVDV
jgi:protocatechuate 3,4-dioxygenase beta subunit